MINPSTIKIGDTIEYKFTFMEDTQKCTTGRVTGIHVCKFWTGTETSFSVDNEDVRVGGDEVVKIIN